MADQDWRFIGQSAVFDLTGQVQAQRTYDVYGYSPETIRLSPEVVRNAQGDPLPALGSLYDSGSFAVLRSYRTSQDQSSRRVRAIAEFSTRPFGSLPPRPIEEDPNYSALNLSTWTGTLGVPIAVRTSISKGTEIVPGWNRRTFIQRMGYEKFQYRVTEQNVSAAEFDLIRSQTGKLHLFSRGGGPAYYQFEGAKIQQTDARLYTILYEWNREEGIPFFGFGFDNEWSDGSPTVFPIPPVNATEIRTRLPDWGEDGEWAVPPYHRPELGIDVGEADVANQPKYAHIFTGELANDGWVNLPGLLG